MSERDLTLGTPSINAGGTPGYEYATEQFIASQLWATAYLYRKTGEQRWHYYTASQEGLTCDQLTNNPDAQAAFKGICQAGGH